MAGVRVSIPRLIGPPNSQQGSFTTMQDNVKSGIAKQSTCVSKSVPMTELRGDATASGLM